MARLTRLSLGAGSPTAKVPVATIPGPTLSSSGVPSRSPAHPNALFEGIDVNFWHSLPVLEYSQRRRSQALDGISHSSLNEPAHVSTSVGVGDKNTLLLALYV